MDVALCCQRPTEINAKNYYFAQKTANTFITISIKFLYHPEFPKLDTQTQGI
jgi:hypothetical protein